MQPENSKDTGEPKPLISKDQLKAILHAHKLWLDSEGKEGQMADLKGANLKGAILISSNLQGANLQGANLYGAYLKKASLKNADLVGANLRGANLRCEDCAQAPEHETCHDVTDDPTHNQRLDGHSAFRAFFVFAA